MASRQVSDIETPQQRSARSRRARRGEEAPPPRALNKHRRGQARTGVTAKEQLAEAFQRMGGVAGLVKWGKKNPTEFFRLWARLIPKEDSLTVTNVGIEDLLAQLDAQGAASGEAKVLTIMDNAGAELGLARPAPSDEEA